MDTQPNLVSPAVVRSLLAEHGLSPKRRLGQNFLVDRNILDKIVRAAELGPESSVLEIGPGLGTVTRDLAARSARIVAVEADRDLIPILRQTLSDCHNVEIVEADFLKLPIRQFLTQRGGESEWTVVANLPYYITTPIITGLLDVKDSVKLIVVMVQKEVAQRLTVAPGSPGCGAITAFVHYHCDVELVGQVSRHVFWPPPEVDSTIIKLTVRERPAVDAKDEALFFAVVRAAFGQRRKTMLNALVGASGLSASKEQVEQAFGAASIDAGRRGETLSLGEFGRVADALHDLRL